MTGVPGLTAGFIYPLFNTASPAGALAGTYEIVIVFFAADAPLNGRRYAFLDVSEKFIIE